LSTLILTISFSRGDKILESSFFLIDSSFFCKSPLVFIASNAAFTASVFDFSSCSAYVFRGLSSSLRLITAVFGPMDPPKLYRELGKAKLFFLELPGDSLLFELALSLNEN
jgi:hypothetical protein